MFTNHAILFSEKDGYWALTKWIVLLPIKVLLYYTIPDCRKPK